MLLRRLLRPGAPPAALPHPDPPVCVVGDVHGCADLLERLLEQIEARRAATPNGAAARLIFAGDLIDRGPDSAAVLARVQALCRPDSAAAQALMGNHERLMLDFLADPERLGLRWLANGGADTLLSFGIPGAFAGLTPARLAALADSLRAALPPGQEAWLRGLPLLWQDGALAVSHAGADPDRPLAAQLPETLLWGHRAFRRRPRGDGIWLVHGHVIVPEVRATAGRIGTDTGAYATGRLSAAWLDPGGLTVIEAQA